MQIHDLTRQTPATGSQLVFDTGSATYKALVSDIAKVIIENYNGTSLAGSAQTPKAAIDGMNGKLTTMYAGQGFTGAGESQIKTSITDYIDTLGAGLYTKWSTGGDASAVGSPTAHSYYYIIVKLNPTTVLLHAVRMASSGADGTDIYVKQRYGTGGWWANWSRIPGAS